MDSIEQRKELRMKVLRKIYEKSGGEKYKYISQHELREELGCSDEEISSAADYLLSERLVESTLERDLSITQPGIKRVEQ